MHFFTKLLLYILYSYIAILLRHYILGILCKLIKAPLQLLYISAYIQLITFGILMASLFNYH